MRVLGRNPVVDDQHRHARCGHILPYRQVVQTAEVLEAEDHAAAVQVQRRAAGLLGLRSAIPGGVELRAVAGGHGVLGGFDTGGGRPVGGDVVEHPVTVDPARLDVADRRRLDFTKGLQQRSQFRQHLGVQS